MVEDIRYDQAEGFVSEFINHGVLDNEGFEKKWRELKALEILGSIAKRILDIDELEQHPKLKSALLEAYLKGEGVNK